MNNLNSYGLQNIKKINFNNLKSSLTKKIITNHDLCLKFEKKISNLTGSKYTISCNNGTSALMMAILALKIKNIVAIIPNINFVASANIVALLKGKIIFCDVNPNNGMIDGQSLIRTLKKCKRKNIKPNLLIPMHYAGNYCDMENLANLCKKEKIFIIEDGCHSFGTKDLNNDYIGISKKTSFTTFSFHPVKNITTIEGGAITTNNQKLYNNLKNLRSHNLVKTNFNDPYRMISPSLNFRMGEVNALVGLEQIKQMHYFKKKRIILVNHYISKMSKFNDYFDIVNFKSKKIFWHLFVILLKGNLKSKKLHLMNYLKNNNIGTQIHYKPLSLHKAYKKFTLLNDSDNSMKFYKSQLTLPLHVNMNKEDVDFIVKKISNFLKKY